jgi:hypothetical protein
MQSKDWKKEAACLDFDRELFFEKYEENLDVRSQIDEFCRECPVRSMCFAEAISTNAWGVWGGIYLENGEISREFNRHKERQDWADTWQALTMEQ